MQPTSCIENASSIEINIYYCAHVYFYVPLKIICASVLVSFCCSFPGQRPRCTGPTAVRDLGPATISLRTPTCESHPHTLTKHTLTHPHLQLGWTQFTRDGDPMWLFAVRMVIVVIWTLFIVTTSITQILSCFPRDRVRTPHTHSFYHSLSHTHTHTILTHTLSQYIFYSHFFLSDTHTYISFDTLLVCLLLAVSLRNRPPRVS